jgi:AcrR family transcriptional regulator
MNALPRQDRRHRKHEATRQEILDVAWDMVREEGLAALSLRALARTVGMEAQSLYTYFPSKHAIYDAMFAQGNAVLLEQRAALVLDPDPVVAIHQTASQFVRFCTDDPVRYLLLFQRTIPGFEPSEESYALARGVIAFTLQRLDALGIHDQADLDLFTALISGLVNQQISNEPGGTRWIRHVERMVDMYLREVAGIRRPAKKGAKT